MYKPFVKPVHKTNRFANIKQNIPQRGENDSEVLKTLRCMRGMTHLENMEGFKLNVA